MIPGTSAATMVGYIMLGIVLSVLIIEVREAIDDHQKRKHELAKQRLDHKQEVDSLTLREEYGLETGEEKEKALKEAYESGMRAGKKEKEGELMRRRMQSAVQASNQQDSTFGHTVHVSCVSCGDILKSDEAAKLSGGSVVWWACQREQCRRRAGQMYQQYVVDSRYSPQAKIRDL